MRVRVRFTPQLRRFLDAPPQEVDAGTPREALERVFVCNPRLRAYLLDDAARLRRHVALFVGGRLARGDDALDRPLGADDHLDVMQALSGG